MGCVGIAFSDLYLTMVSFVCSAVGLIKTQALFLVQERITVKRSPLPTLSCIFMTQKAIMLENDVLLVLFFKQWK